MTKYFPQPTNPAFTVRPITSRLGAVVETNRPNCTAGYIALRPEIASFSTAPDGLIAVFLEPPQQPKAASENRSMRNASKPPIRARRDRMYGDAYCSSCQGYTGSQAVPVSLGRVACAHCGQPMDVSD